LGRRLRHRADASATVCLFQNEIEILRSNYLLCLIGLDDKGIVYERINRSVLAALAGRDSNIRNMPNRMLKNGMISASDHLWM